MNNSIKAISTKEEPAAEMNLAVVQPPIEEYELQANDDQNLELLQSSNDSRKESLHLSQSAGQAAGPGCLASKRGSKLKAKKNVCF